MNFIYWTIVATLMIVNFGTVLGAILTVLASILLGFIEAFLKAKKEIESKDFADNNVLVNLELTEHNGVGVWLVFDEENKKFLMQSISFNDILDELKKKFGDKNIMLKYRDNVLPMAKFIELRKTTLGDPQ